VASTERSEDGVNRVADTDNDEVERRKAVVERDKQQQREKISRWKVGCLLTYCGDSGGSSPSLWEGQFFPLSTTAPSRV